jgi:transcriptional regulator EpsA
MQLDSVTSPQPLAPRAIELPGLEAAYPPGLARETVDADAHCLSDVDVETLMLNLDAALRVHQRAHFFGWTQGLLQGLLPHEVLICASRSGEPPSLRAESFSMRVAQQAVFGEMFRRDAALVRILIKAWEARGFRPVIADARVGPCAKGPFAVELARVRATQILVHGAHDAQGRTTHLYAFACAPGTIGARQEHLARLLTPLLHSAWMRAEVNGRVNGKETAPAEAPAMVTAREREILGWVSRGKSNYEIGAILDRSPLTVKNQVQRILRKLDVVNRAQAVGRALELRILKL